MSGNIILSPPENSVDEKQIVDGWNDYVSELSQARQGGGTVPSFAAIGASGIYTWQFSATSVSELIISPIHIKHDFKVGSRWHIHVHWLPDNTDTGVVRWGFEYMTAKGHSQSNFAPASTTTIYVEQASSGQQYCHHVAEHATGIIDPEIEPDSLIMARLFRDGTHINDTFTGIAHGLTVDIHYQAERFASLNKAPNFYA